MTRRPQRRRRPSKPALRRIDRRKPTKEPRARVVVATEGRVTEPSYLQDFAELHGHEAVDVVSLRGSSDPRSVVERAKEEKSRAAQDGLSDRDTYWVMFDRDDHAHFDEAVDMAKANDIGLAISIPCFELWAILHYEDWDRPSHRHDCQRRLAELCHAYARESKRFGDLDAIRDNHAQAVARAEMLVNRRTAEGNPLGNPSTTVHCLTEHIRHGVKRA